MGELQLVVVVSGGDGGADSQDPPMASERPLPVRPPPVVT